MLFFPSLTLFAWISLVLASRRDVLLAGRQAYAVTGDKYCSNLMCVAATVNGSTVQYVLSSTGKMQPGWMAMGFGTQMRGTEMVIMWANSDGTITLSQRKATGDSLPPVDSNPTRVATVANDLSITSGSTAQYAYTIPANSDTKQTIIYAFGSQNPNSRDKGADLQIHADMGPALLDLTKQLASSNSTDSGSSGSPSSGSGPSDSGSSEPSSSGSGIDALPLRDYEKLIVAHGILCVVGFLLFLPAGALLARYLRTFTHTWYTGHWILQFGLGAPIITTGVILGIASVTQGGGLHLYDDHMKWGIGLYILYLVQCALGAIIHFFKLKNFRGRPPQNYLHAILGLVTIALALKQVGNGLLTEWPKMTGRSIPSNAKIIWIVWIILLPVLYFVGLAFLPRQYKQEAASRRHKETDEMKMSMVRHDEVY